MNAGRGLWKEATTITVFRQTFFADGKKSIDNDSGGEQLPRSTSYTSKYLRNHETSVPFKPLPYLRRLKTLYRSPGYLAHQKTLSHAIRSVRRIWGRMEGDETALRTHGILIPQPVGHLSCRRAIAVSLVSRMAKSWLACAIVIGDFSRSCLSGTAPIAMAKYLQQ